jgi:hypothetical protein
LAVTGAEAGALQVVVNTRPSPLNRQLCVDRGS